MTIIPAPSGLRLIEAFPPSKGDEDRTTGYWTTDIIAFRIGEPNSYPVPITPMGDAGETKVWAIVYPDGTCSMNGDGYHTLKEWKRDMGLTD